MNREKQFCIYEGDKVWVRPHAVAPTADKTVQKASPCRESPKNYEADDINKIEIIYFIYFFLQYFIVVNLITEKRPAVKFTAADVGPWNFLAIFPSRNSVVTNKICT